MNIKNLIEQWKGEKEVYALNTALQDMIYSHYRKLNAITEQHQWECYTDVSMPLKQEDILEWLSVVTKKPTTKYSTSAVISRSELKEGHFYFGSHRCTKLALWSEGRFKYFQIDMGFNVLENTDYPGEAPDHCTGDCFIPFKEVDSYLKKVPWVSTEISIIEQLLQSN